MREWSTASSIRVASPFHHGSPLGGPARGVCLSHPGALAALSELHLGSRYPFGHFRGCFGLRLRFAVLPDLIGQLRHPLFMFVRCVPLLYLGQGRRHREVRTSAWRSLVPSQPSAG